jgi:hypothetical protein
VAVLLLAGATEFDIIAFIRAILATGLAQWLSKEQKLFILQHIRLLPPHDGEPHGFADC